MIGQLASTAPGPKRAPTAADSPRRGRQAGGPALPAPPLAWEAIALSGSGVLQRAGARGGSCGPAELQVNAPGDRYEQEAERVAARVMRSPLAEDDVPARPALRSPSAVQREGEGKPAPDPISEGLATVGKNLGENNPAFSALVSQLAARFMSQPAPLSVGVPLFLGSNYAFLWTMAMVDPAMRRHFDDFDIATLPGLVPQFPLKTFKYRILDPDQTQFSFEFGLDASALIEAYNEGYANTHISKLAFESAGRLDTRGPAQIDLSSLRVELGLFGDGLLLSGGFRQGISPYPIINSDPLTGETSRLMKQTPALPDLLPDQRDVRFMMMLDIPRLVRYLGPNRGRSADAAPPSGRDTVAPMFKRDPGLGYEHPAPASSIEPVLARPGQSLDGETRAFMESRIGHDFGDVRIHADAQAASSARAVAARAYTVGRDVVFGPNQYAPGTREGRLLLAHELTHVVHQGAGSQAPSRAARADREREGLAKNR